MADPKHIASRNARSLLILVLAIVAGTVAVTMQTRVAQISAEVEALNGTRVACLRFENAIHEYYREIIAEPPAGEGRLTVLDQRAAEAFDQIHASPFGIRQRDLQMYRRELEAVRECRTVLQGADPAGRATAIATLRTANLHGNPVLDMIDRGVNRVDKRIEDLVAASADLRPRAAFSWVLAFALAVVGIAMGAYQAHMRTVQSLNRQLRRKEVQTAALGNRLFALTQATNTVDDAMIELDDHGRILTMNTAAERITGWNLSEAVHLDVDALCELPSPIGVLIADLNEAQELEGDACIRTEGRLVNFEGRSSHVDLRLRTIVDTHGERVGYALALKSIEAPTNGLETIINPN